MNNPSSTPEAIDALAAQLLENLQVKNNRTVVRHLLATALDMASSDYQRLNLKIAADSLRELSHAFRVFEPFHSQKKITLFGSARTKPTDPTYTVAREVAHQLAARGWMTVTGAGQGIMQAGLEGAGPEMSFGVNIKLPFEQEPNPFIAKSQKLVEMKYFFTRKVMLIKESAGFVIMPGGFGTLDEAFELLTLMQTGKAEPAPIVLLDSEEGTYWEKWQEFIDKEVIGRGLVADFDKSLYLITRDVNKAVDEITQFYRNYQSVRYVNKLLVVRMKSLMSESELEKLNLDFKDIVASGAIERCSPSAPEIADNDGLELHRIKFSFNQSSHGRLRELINSLNSLDSAN